MSVVIDTNIIFSAMLNTQNMNSKGFLIFSLVKFGLLTGS